MDTGKIFFVGAGPGDYGLITLKGMECIRNADVILYDRLINKRYLNQASPDAKLIYAGKENTAGGKIQDAINRQLVDWAKQGKNVVRLKGGDPFLFGRGAEEIEVLLDAGIEFEVIPGITSALAVPAYAGIPVTHRDYSSSVHIFTGHKKEGILPENLDQIAKLEGTLVFLMGIEYLTDITAALIRHGKHPETPAAVISNGTTGCQQTVTGTLKNIYQKTQNLGIQPPAVTVIGDTVKLADKMQWLTPKKLSGLKIAVTRNRTQAEEFSGKLAAEGAEPVEVPFIDIRTNENSVPDLKSYQTILFNSANAVRFFMQKIPDIRILAGCCVGIVGTGTRQELMKYKIIPDFMPEQFTVKAAIDEAVRRTGKQGAILMVTSDLSPVNAGQISREFDIRLDKLALYQTVKLQKSQTELAALFNEMPNIITFLSSSTVDSFFENIGNAYKSELTRIKLASIGPETSRTIRQYGYKPEIEAETYTTGGLIDAIIQWRNKNKD